jgi:hypothetical protein
VRGFVGTGEQVMIQGITVNGPEPIRALISVKGPSLSTSGITGTLANPRIDLYDSGRRRIATNDDIGPVVAGSEVALIPGYPTNSAEAALVVVLPPGNYTAIVSSATGTGVALLEVTDLRNPAPGVVTPAGAGELVVRNSGPAKITNGSGLVNAAIELCAAVPLGVTVVTR